MLDTLDALLPAFAPLPEEFLRHILTNRRRDTILKKSKRAPDTVKIKPTTPLEEQTRFTQAEWETLLHDIKPIRQAVFEEMDAAIRGERLNTAWISEQLLKATPQRAALHSSPREGQGPQERKRLPREHTGIPRTTLATWQGRGLAEFGVRYSPDPDVFAAIWITRLIDTTRLRNWLPGRIALYVDRALDTQSAEVMDSALTTLARQAWLVCWRWDPPTEAGGLPPNPIACPVPLPAGLQKATVLASPWQGLMWRPYWRRRINSLGVARWYGANEDGWDVSLDDLARWFKHIGELAVPNMEQSAPDVLQALDDIALNRLGHTLLSRGD